MPEVEIKMIGTPVELKHEDYRGKRIYLSIKDASMARVLRTKVDIGVHVNDDLAQINFKFPTGSGEGSVELQANSPEQMFAEKLLSLLRHGANSNRPKDIFDMYYLADHLDTEKLRDYIALIIYGNPKCRVNNHSEMMKLVRLIFGLKTFTGKLAHSRANWLQIPADIALEFLDHFLETLS
jgi:predicted nucleotidyltransferase component of viral defense system